MKKLLAFLVMLVFLSTVLFSFAAPGASSSLGKTITVSGVIVKVNPGMPYNKEMPALKTAEATYILTGNINNIEKYIGYNASMTGNAQRGPQGILFFNVKNYKIIAKPSPTPITNPTIVPSAKPSIIPSSIPSIPSSSKPSAVISPIPSTVPVVTPPAYVVLKGYLTSIPAEKIRLILKSDTGAYELMGNTEGMEKVIGKRLEVTGNYVYTLVATEFPLFSVVSYKVIDEPTITVPPTASPSAVIITVKDDGGYVYVKSGDEVKLILESNQTTGYSWNFDQKPDEKVLLLTNHEYIQNQAPEGMVGVGGNEIWTFKAVASGTAVMYLSYARPWESVPPAKSFKVKVIVDQLVTPTPAYDVLKGNLIVTKVEPVTNEKLMSSYSFTLKTEKGPFTLQGKVDGMEALNGMDIEVTGTISPLDIYPPIFTVVSYIVLTTPTVTPVPTPVISGKTHTIISDKAMYFNSPYMGSMLLAIGNTTISWTENTQNAFFKAKINLPTLNSITNYEFELVETQICDSNSITGLFNITLNGKILAEKISGKLYGLDAPVGTYFKFYSDDFKWHMSAYVTNRIDF